MEYDIYYSYRQSKGSLNKTQHSVGPKEKNTNNVMRLTIFNHIMDLMLFISSKKIMYLLCKTFFQAS